MSENKTSEERKELRPLVLDDIQKIENIAHGYYLVHNTNHQIGNVKNVQIHSVVLDSFKVILQTIKSLIT